MIIVILNVMIPKSINDAAIEQQDVGDCYFYRRVSKQKGIYNFKYFNYINIISILSIW